MAANSCVASPCQVDGIGMQPCSRQGLWGCSMTTDVLTTSFCKLDSRSKNILPVHCWNKVQHAERTNCGRYLAENRFRHGCFTAAASSAASTMSLNSTSTSFVPRMYSRFFRACTNCPGSYTNAQAMVPLNSIPIPLTAVSRTSVGCAHADQADSLCSLISSRSSKSMRSIRSWSLSSNSDCFD